MEELSFNIKGQLKLLQHSLFPPKSSFSPDQIPDLSGKVMVVTGRHSFCLTPYLPIRASDQHRLPRTQAETQAWAMRLSRSS